MPAFVRSELTSRLVAFFASMKKGESITYAELSRMVGSPVSSTSGMLLYARKIVEAESNVVVVPVLPRIGVRRLDDREIAERLPRWWLRGAGNKLKRGGEQIESVEMSALDIDEQARFSVSCIQQELAANALSKATRRKMEKIARGSSNDLPTFTAVEWAISLSPRKKE